MNIFESAGLTLSPCLLRTVCFPVTLLDFENASFLVILFDKSRIVARGLLKLQPSRQQDNQHAKARAFCGTVHRGITDIGVQTLRVNRAIVSPEKWRGLAKTVLKCRNICIKNGVGFLSCAIAHAQTNPEVHIAVCDKVLSRSVCPSTLFRTE